MPTHRPNDRETKPPPDRPIARRRRVARDTPIETPAHAHARREKTKTMRPSRRGAAARRRGAASWRGVAARRRGAASWRGVAARRRGEVSSRGVRAAGRGRVTRHRRAGAASVIAAQRRDAASRRRVTSRWDRQMSGGGETQRQRESVRALRSTNHSRRRGRRCSSHRSDKGGGWRWHGLAGEHGGRGSERDSADLRW